MRCILMLAVLTLLCAAGNGYASGYEITKVIEVGPGHGAVVGTTKWSPDGSKLAYFNRTALLVSDTLGASREVTQFDLPPHRYEWLSNDEMLVHLKLHRGGPSDTNALALVDINSAQVTILESYVRGPGGTQPDGIPNSFGGPYLTVEGTPYYRTNVVKRPNSGPQGTEFPASMYMDGDMVRSHEGEHIVAWGKDGLYLQKADLSDSTRIAPKPYSNLFIPPATTMDLSYYAQGGTMYRFADSTYIVLDTIPKEFPPETGAVEIMDISFCPRSTEVVFTVVFWDGDEYELLRVGTFDYVSGGFVIIDPLIGLEGCERPVYAPDGRKIAFQHDGKVHLLYRGDR